MFHPLLSPAGGGGGWKNQAGADPHTPARPTRPVPAPIPHRDPEAGGLGGLGLSGGQEPIGGMSLEAA